MLKSGTRSSLIDTYRHDVRITTYLRTYLCMYTGILSLKNVMYHRPQAFDLNNALASKRISAGATKFIVSTFNTIPKLYQRKMFNTSP